MRQRRISALPKAGARNLSYFIRTVLVRETDGPGLSERVAKLEKQMAEIGELRVHLLPGHGKPRLLGVGL